MLAHRFWRQRGCQGLSSFGHFTTAFATCSSILLPICRSYGRGTPGKRQLPRHVLISVNRQRDDGEPLAFPENYGATHAACDPDSPRQQVFAAARSPPAASASGPCPKSNDDPSLLLAVLKNPPHPRPP